MNKKYRRSLMSAAVLLLVVLGMFLLNPVEVLAQSDIEEIPPSFQIGSDELPSPTVIYLFWGDGCPHCADAEAYLMPLAEASDQIELRMYEVWNDEDNQSLFIEMAAAFGFEPQGVPTIFIDDQYWVGFGDPMIPEIQAKIETCAVDGCADAGAGIAPEAAVVVQEAVPSPQSESSGGAAGSQIVLPIIGEIDLSSQSLLMSTLLIAFVDGFNPCSIWVLTMLLALTLHTGSRKKVLVIGIIFLTVTAAIYALFIAGLFTMFTVVSFVGWIQVVVALVALFFGLVNIKDYFWYKEGLSFTIADDKKPGIFQRMRRLMDASQSFGGLVAGTVVLAAGVSLVEFSCTAGFPVIWTNLLVSQEMAATGFILLLLAYVAVYQLDELGIFFVAVYTMRSSKVEEKHGRILKLIGGMLMISLAGVMLVNPNLMSDLSSSLVVFGIAFGATLILLLLHRLVLPKLGVRIGTEFNSKKKSKKFQKKS